MYCWIYVGPKQVVWLAVWERREKLARLLCKIKKSEPVLDWSPDRRLTTTRSVEMNLSRTLFEMRFEFCCRTKQEKGAD